MNYSYISKWYVDIVELYTYLRIQLRAEVYSNWTCCLYQVGHRNLHPRHTNALVLKKKKHQFNFFPIFSGICKKQNKPSSVKANVWA